MEISVNIKVQNPNWYWSKGEIKEFEKAESISRKEWEKWNEDKIPKHSFYVDFEYKFEVNSFIEKNGIYNLKIYLPNNGRDELTEVIFPLEDVTFVEFIGEGKRGCTIISNELIHQFIGARKGKGGRYYWYFYLKESAENSQVATNIWISDVQKQKLINYLKSLGRPSDEFFLGKDLNIKIRNSGGLFPAP